MAVTVPSPLTPAGRFHVPAAIRDVLPAIAEAAQRVYDEWEQVDGHDEVLGAGGICQDVANAMTDVLAGAGIEDVLSVHAQVGENHVFVVAMLPDGIYEIDIPPSVYEIGSGYVWKKREGVTIGSDDVLVGRLGDAMPSDDFSECYGA